MRERRHYLRSDGLVLVNYKIPEMQLEGKSSAYDVGGAGARITVDQQLKIGVMIEMEIYLPGDSQPILAKGRLIWLEKCKEAVATQFTTKKEYFYAGINFTTMSEPNRNKVIHYVKRKTRQLKEKI